MVEAWRSGAASRVPNQRGSSFPSYRPPPFRPAHDRNSRRELAGISTRLGARTSFAQGRPMPAPRPLSASVLICTYDRDELLRQTLVSLAAMTSVRAWEVVIVDNNSTDDTRSVVERMVGSFPVPLQYVFEP